MEAKEKATITAAPKRQSKDSKHLADCQKVFEYFALKPATMFQCEISTGIPRPYICRYVGKLRKSNDIQILKLDRCPISKYDGVQFLTTDKGLFNSQVKEPSLFDEL